MLAVTSRPPSGNDPAVGEEEHGNSGGRSMGERPRLVSLTRRVHELLCQAGIKVAEAGGQRRWKRCWWWSVLSDEVSPSHEVGRSVFETVPARLPALFWKLVGLAVSLRSAVRFSFHFEIGESPRCCPVLRGLRDRCIAAMLTTQDGSQWSCSTSCGGGSVRFPTGGGTLVRFDFHGNWRPRMGSHHRPPESESGALLFELQGYTKWFRGLESNQLPPSYEADERLGLFPGLFPGIENDPPAGAAPAWSALRVRCIADLCHGGMLGAEAPY
jgi:hypothetical protein